MKKLIVFGLALFLVLRLEAGTPMGMPEGKGELTVGEGERAIQVYTY